VADNSLIDDQAADRFLAGHPDPDLPLAWPKRHGRMPADERANPRKHSGRPSRNGTGSHVYGVSAETLCAEFHKPLPRKRASTK